MIFDLPNWWSFLTYDGLKSHVSVTDAFRIFSEERNKVGKEKAGTSAFNQACDKLQVKHDKDQTRQLLYMEHQKAHGRINQWQIIMIISTAIQNIPA